MNGFLFYRGASPIDRAPLIGIATLESDNRKTGNMVQTWILREDISPTMARSTGGIVHFVAIVASETPATLTGDKHPPAYGTHTIAEVMWTCAASLR